MSITQDDSLFTESTQVQEADLKSRKYLIFMIHDTETADLKLGVDAEYVVEILNGYNVTFLPMMPDYVRGIFNMRGQIIPVTDMRLRLDKDASDDGLLIVLNYNGMQLGVIVDAVDKIIDIDNNIISVAPSQDSQRFVSGICTIPDRTGTLMILDCEQLFAHE